MTISVPKGSTGSFQGSAGFVIHRLMHHPVRMAAVGSSYRYGMMRVVFWGQDFGVLSMMKFVTVSMSRNAATRSWPRVAMVVQIRLH